jgi:squalene-hopene/tetraprenyl-beta-curcumene cyclase
VIHLDIPIRNATMNSLVMQVLASALALAGAEIFAAEPPYGPPKPKPEFQYDVGEIRIPLPSADGPRVQSFGAESIRAAAQYLDDGALAWTREKSCVACHTTGAYLLDRPSLTAQLGKPSEEVHAAFVKGVQDTLPPTKHDGFTTYYAQSERAVWRAACLVQWDKHVTGKLSEATARALHAMLLQQASHGGFYMPGEVEIPYDTTDYELTLHAARALVEAPGWLASLRDADLLQRIERLKAFLRKTQPRNDYERALRIGLATFLPELVRPEDHESDIAMLWAKQHTDGGWSTRDMSDVHNWRTPMSERVVQLIESLPDAAHPSSDPFMTALAIILLRESAIPADDPRIRRGVTWLKAEQRKSGWWWMHSLYRGNYHFTTYIATAKALRALAVCGEIPVLERKP